MIVLIEKKSYYQVYRSNLFDHQSIQSSILFIHMVICQVFSFEKIQRYRDAKVDAAQFVHDDLSPYGIFPFLYVIQAHCVSQCDL